MGDYAAESRAGQGSRAGRARYPVRWAARNSMLGEAFPHPSRRHHGRARRIARPAHGGARVRVPTPRRARLAHRRAPHDQRRPDLRDARAPDEATPRRAGRHHRRRAPAASPDRGGGEGGDGVARGGGCRGRRPVGRDGRPRADRPLAARLRRRRRRGRGAAPVDGATRRGIRRGRADAPSPAPSIGQPATRPTSNAPSPPSRGWRHPRNSRVRTPRSPGSTCWAPSRDWPTRPAPTGRGGVAGRARPPRRALSRRPLSRPTRSCRPPRGRGGTRPGSRRTAAARRPAPTPPPRRPPRRRPRAVHAR